MTDRAERHVVVPVELLSDLWRYGNLNRVDGVLYGKSHADRLKEADDILCKALSAAPPVQMEAVGKALERLQLVSAEIDNPYLSEAVDELAWSLSRASPVPSSERDDINDDIERMSGIEEDMREQASGEQSGWLLKCADQLRERITSLRGEVARLQKERDYAVRWANRAVDDVKEASAVERDDIIEMCAATVERHVRDLDARPDSWMAAWAKECAAHLRSLKSQPAQEAE